MQNLGNIIAMATPPAGQGAGNSMQFFPFMIIMFGILYFMLIRPQQRKEKERREMIKNVKSGDRILFAGGILGSVVNVKESILVVKIADNVKVEISRGAVARVLEKGETVSDEVESK